MFVWVVSVVWVLLAMHIVVVIMEPTKCTAVADAALVVWAWGLHLYGPRRHCS